MQKYLVSINDLPPDGKEFNLDDQDIWKNPITEFKMDCQIIEPLHSKIIVQPADEGVLVRGDLTGVISMPCNRCAEDAVAKIASEFSEYEEVPPEDKNRKEGDRDGCIIYQMRSPMLDLAKVAWEQFMLALPSNPLCKEDCQGLCPECGANLNQGQCSCEKESGDPRLATLRNLTVSKK